MEDVKKNTTLSEEAVETDDTVEEVEETLPEDEVDETPEEVEDEKAEPGDKTESAKLLVSLKKERARRRALEEDIKKLKSSDLSDNEEEPDEANTRIDRLEKEREVEKAISQNPLLKGKEADFEEFLEDEDNAGISVSRLAKLFIAEKDLGKEKRKGLEKSTGGDKTEVKTHLTSEEASELRKSNFRQYTALLKSGKLKIK